jgi:hypothetical protein
MAGLVPAIHAPGHFVPGAWMPGTRACPGLDPGPGMTSHGPKPQRRLAPQATAGISARLMPMSASSRSSSRVSSFILRSYSRHARYRRISFARNMVDPFVLLAGNGRGFGLCLRKGSASATAVKGLLLRRSNALGACRVTSLCRRNIQDSASFDACPGMLRPSRREPRRRNYKAVPHGPSVRAKVDRPLRRVRGLFRP